MLLGEVSCPLRVLELCALGGCVYGAQGGLGAECLRRNYCIVRKGSECVLATLPPG